MSAGEPKTVRVLYFAVVRDLVGVGEETLSLGGDVRTLRALAAHLEALHPALRGRLGPVRFARNERFARLDDPLEPGDVVALVPPVSGG